MSDGDRLALAERLEQTLRVMQGARRSNSSCSFSAVSGERSSCAASATKARCASNDADSRASLMAHCVALGVNAVRAWERRPAALAHADQLAASVGLDMSAYWTPTSSAYFSRVTKARIGEAVREAVSQEAADRLAGLKKPEMAEAAERLVVDTGWLPRLLRTSAPESTTGFAVAAE